MNNFDFPAIKKILKDLWIKWKIVIYPYFWDMSFWWDRQAIWYYISEKQNEQIKTYWELWKKDILTPISEIFIKHIDIIKDKYIEFPWSVDIYTDCFNAIKKTLETRNLNPLEWFARKLTWIK